MGWGRKSTANKCTAEIDAINAIIILLLCIISRIQSKNTLSQPQAGYHTFTVAGPSCHLVTVGQLFFSVIIHVYKIKKYISP